MSVHLLRVQTESPAMTRSWYIKSCEFRARDYLRRGRSIDSYKRARGGEPTHSQDFDQNFELSDPLGCLDEVMARTLSPSSCAGSPTGSGSFSVFCWKVSEWRAVGRQLGIAHTAVVKQRVKIGRVARGLWMSQ